MMKLIIIIMKIILSSSSLMFYCDCVIVDVIAPSKMGNETKIPKVLNFIESLNLKGHISDNVYRNVTPFYSNSDEFRANDLIESLIDDSKFIWCIIGGQGSARLIPYLETLPLETKQKIANNTNNKILIGYSDATVLHIYLQVKYNWQTMHATMLELIINKAVSDKSVHRLTSLLIGSKNHVKYNIKLINNERFTDVGIDSVIIGGCLTLVENSIATTWQINAQNKILFLEDIYVAAYSLERSLDHFKQANLLTNVKAVIFGNFHIADDDKLIEIVKKRFADSVDFPVFTLKGVGHGYVNMPLPLNTRTHIYSNSNNNNNNNYKLYATNVYYNS